MGTPNIHFFHAITGQAKVGLNLPNLALVRQTSQDAAPEVVQAGRGFLLGAPRGSMEIAGKRHLILRAPKPEQSGGDDFRVVWADAAMPRLVENPVNGLENAVEGTIVTVGPRQYTITARRADDQSHTIHVRTGVVRQQGETLDQALTRFFTRFGVEELGFHGSYARERDVSHVEGVESADVLPQARVEHLKWFVSREKFTREDNNQIPLSRDDVWNIPEGGSLVVVDPAIIPGSKGRQRTFVVRVENGKLVTRPGGKVEFDRFLELEFARLRKRSGEAARRQAAKVAKEVDNKT